MSQYFLPTVIQTNFSDVLPKTSRRWYVSFATHVVRFSTSNPLFLLFSFRLLVNLILSVGGNIKILWSLFFSMIVFFGRKSMPPFFIFRSVFSIFPFRSPVSLKSHVSLALFIRGSVGRLNYIVDDRGLDCVSVSRTRRT